MAPRSAGCRETRFPDLVAGALVLLLGVTALSSRAKADEPVPAPAPDAASAPPRLPVAVLSVPEADREDLLVRLRGQTSDLDLVLDTRVLPAAPAAFTRVERTTWIAAQTGVRFGVSVGRDDAQRFVVTVADREAGRVAERTLAASGTMLATERSAELESVAVACRTILRAFLLGEPVENAAPVPVLPDISTPLTTPVPQPSLLPPRPRPSEPVDVWVTGVGVESRFDGIHRTGEHGPALTVRRTFSRWEVTAQGAFALPVTVDDALGTFSVLQVQALVGGGWTALGAGRWTFLAGARAGGAWVRRSQATVQAPVEHTGSARHWLFVGRAGVEARVRISDRWSAELSAAAEMSWPSLRYGVQDETGFLDRLSPWAVRPVADLLASYRF